MDAQLKEYTDDEVEEFLTEVAGTFKIGCLEFDAGRVVKELDPIAFNCTRNDDMPNIWICSECDSEHEDEDVANECCTD